MPHVRHTLRTTAQYSDTLLLMLLEKASCRTHSVIVHLLPVRVVTAQPRGIRYTMLRTTESGEVCPVRRHLHRDQVVFGPRQCVCSPLHYATKCSHRRKSRQHTDAAPQSRRGCFSTPIPMKLSVRSLRFEYPDSPHSWLGSSQRRASRIQGQCRRVCYRSYPACRYPRRNQVAASQRRDVHFVLLNVTVSSLGCLVN